MGYTNAEQAAFVTLTIIAVLFIFRTTREIILSDLETIVENVTSKCFITLMIVTWFVYQRVEIDPNWIILAGFFIGVDTMQKNGVFGASADFQKNRKNLSSELKLSLIKSFEFFIFLFKIFRSIIIR